MTIGLILAAALSAAAPAAPDQRVLVLGLGNQSCATWLHPSHTDEGKAWIVGYWSGLNQNGGRNVGRSTDGAGILGEVERICREQPSYPLYAATFIAFDALKSQGR